MLPSRGKCDICGADNQIGVILMFNDDIDKFICNNCVQQVFDILSDISIELDYEED